MRERIADGERGWAYWEGYDRDIGRAIVRPVTIPAARRVIERYEWLGTMPAIIWHCYGIYFGDALGGVVTYGPDYGENLGVWDKYGFTGKIVLLSRGACVHWAHEHSASKLIRRSMRLLPAKYEVVTATVDADAGEVGTIYQAAGFSYAVMNTHSRNGAIVRGQPYTTRSLRDNFGVSSLATLTARFGADAVQPLPEQPKGRYFAFRGRTWAQQAHMDKIKHLMRPYPRRDDAAPASQPYKGAQAQEDAPRLFLAGSG